MVQYLNFRILEISHWYWGHFFPHQQSGSEWVRGAAATTAHCDLRVVHVLHKFTVILWKSGVRTWTWHASLMIHDDSWRFMMIHHDSWWFMMIHHDSSIHMMRLWFQHIESVSLWSEKQKTDVQISSRRALQFLLQVPVLWETAWHLPIAPAGTTSLTSQQDYCQIYWYISWEQWCPVQDIPKNMGQCDFTYIFRILVRHLYMWVSLWFSEKIEVYPQLTVTDHLTAGKTMIDRWFFAASLLFGTQWFRCHGLASWSWNLTWCQRLLERQ